MKNKKMLFLTHSGLIAAIYVVITVALSPFSFGQIQVRASEMLTILPIFTPAAVPGLFIGCLISNIICGAALPDIIFGSLATLAAAFLTHKLKEKSLVLAELPPIIINAVVVPFVLKYAYGVPLPIPFMMVTVGVGEAISVGVLGTVLAKVFGKNKVAIFGNY